MYFNILGTGVCYLNVQQGNTFAKTIRDSTNYLFSGECNSKLTHMMRIRECLTTPSHIINHTSSASYVALFPVDGSSDAEDQITPRSLLKSVDIYLRFQFKEKHIFCIEF